MTISREKCFEMTKEFCDAELTYKGRDEYSFDIYGIEALINRAYKEGQKDMRERAAKACESEYGAYDCYEKIKELEIE